MLLMKYPRRGVTAQKFAIEVENFLFDLKCSLIDKLFYKNLKYLLKEICPLNIGTINCNYLNFSHKVDTSRSQNIYSLIFFTTSL